jgi:hypothetical protein
MIFSPFCALMKKTLRARLLAAMTCVTRCVAQAHNLLVNARLSLDPQQQMQDQVKQVILREKLAVKSRAMEID